MPKKPSKGTGAHEIEFFVSSQGNNAWSGHRATPNRRKTDGPFATIHAAQKAVRNLRLRDRSSGTVRVRLRGGVHFLKKPLVLTPRDSGVPEAREWHQTGEPESPVIYCAYKDEQAVLSGGRRITNWKIGELNGKTVWTAKLPQVKSGKWYFRQLWVNGERRHRPCLPRQGEYRIARVLDARFKGNWAQTVGRGTSRFIYSEGDIDPNWRNLSDVELMFLTLWVSIRTQIESVDSKKRLVTMDRNSGYRLAGDFSRDGAPYIVENVFEALEEPGQWYLDRAEGKLYYLPLPGENPKTAEVIAPALCELVRFEGDLSRERHVECVRLEDLTFSHNEFDPPKDYACSSQAATGVPAAVAMRGARNCALERCSFTRLGTYGVDLVENCSEVVVRGCDFDDLGAGGVKIWHGCRRNIVSDCDIGNGGILYPSAVGAIIGRSSGNQVIHNHIHDLYYTGISVGWNWGYEEGDAYGNIIEWNHIHDLGKGRLSDMGGIYTLGPQPGTRLRFNHIHHVTARSYGGWAIYPDEGSSDILIENNLCYRTQCAPFRPHYCRENLVRNNIFALGKEAQLGLGRGEHHVSFTFERNIVYFDEGVLIRPGHGVKEWSPDVVVFRSNLYWDASGRKLDFAGSTFGQWQKKGMDRGSIVADPKFVNAGAHDFRLKRNSPAFELGFQPFDVSAAGPRAEFRNSRRQSSPLEP